MRLLSFITLLLSFSALAQASFPPLESNQGAEFWVSTHAGTTVLDQVNVIAALEQSQDGVEIPLSQEGQTKPLLPISRSYRLKLVVAEQPSLQVNYALVPRTIIVNGQAQLAYVSDSSIPSDFNFVILSEKDGRLHASYTRRIDAIELNKGDFILNPVPHILRK
jgi:hypothetical protein